MKRVYIVIKISLLMSLFLAFTFKVNAGETHWQINGNAYQYDMQMYIRLMSNGEELGRWEEIEVAAFAANECRGVAVPINVGGVRLYSLKVRSNSVNEEITFKYYDNQSAKEIALLQTAVFISDATYGDVRTPFVLSTPVELRPSESTNAIYVAPDGCADGSSPNKAAGDIQQALDRAYALNATSVRLTPGTYRLIKTLMLRPGVSLKGEGNAPVILDGQGVFRLLEMETAVGRAVPPQLTVSNLTLQNGSAKGNGGAALLNDNVTVENCLFKNNSCTDKGGAMYGGKAFHCLYEGNSANQGGAVAMSELDYCTVVRNISNTNSGAALRSLLSNSIVWANGGGSQMSDCTLLGVALEAVKGSATGEKLLYLSSDNSLSTELGYWAPLFVNPDQSSWMLSEQSPLSKLSLVDGKRCDIGYYNETRNVKAHVYTSVEFQGTLVYKETYLPVVKEYDLWNQSVEGANVTVYYRNEEQLFWSTDKPTKAGKYQVKAKVSSSDLNWRSSESSENIADMTIAPRKVTVTAQMVSKVYGEQDPLLTYDLSESLAAGVVTGKLVRQPGEHVTGYSIEQGTLAVSSDYTMTFQTGTFTITPRPVTVTALAATKMYGNIDPEFFYTLSSDLGEALIGSDQPTGKLSRQSGEGVNTYSIVQGTLSLPQDYQLTYKTASFTITPRLITVTADAVEKVYGEKDPIFSYRITSGATLVDGDSFVGSLAREAGEKIGTYELTKGTLALNSNYNFVFIPAKLTISKRPVTVHITACSKQYGQADPEFTYTLTSVYTPALKDGDSSSGTFVREQGEHVGTYKLFPGSFVLTDDYEVNYQNGSLTIVPLPVAVKANSTGKAYGDSDPELTYTVQPSLIGSDNLKGQLQRSPGENSGKYLILQGTISSSEDYVLNFVSADFVISKRRIEVTANPASSVYGEKEASLTFDYAPQLVKGDKFTGFPKRIGGNNIGTYVINRGSLDLPDNYELFFNEGIYTITPRPVTLMASNATKNYGESDPELTLSVAGMGLVYNDSYHGTLGREPGENVGVYVINRGTVELSGNYLVESFTGAKFQIIPSKPEIRIEGLTQTYDRLAKAVTVITDPEGLNYQVTYNGSVELPVQVGEYEVLVTVKTQNYVGQKTETMHIVKPEQEKVVCTQVASLSDGTSFETHYEEFCSNSHLRIYNQRGKQIYENKNYQSGEYSFDGLSVGTYYYVLTYRTELGEQKNQKGFVELIP